jgi:rSAM/selenodomain-associated transferase 1
LTRKRDAVVALFAKAPVPGEVNTRLTPAISAEEAAALQQTLILDRLEMLCAAGNGDIDVQLWCSPGTQHPFFLDCATRFPISLHPQQGNDLGDRMERALAQMLAQYRRALIIGADAPSLGPRDIRSAHQALSDHDYVLTPAEDGGYVLIGSRRAVPGVLQRIDWGTHRVLLQTCTALEKHGLTCALTDTRWDIDRPEDLERYRALTADR